jgi:hypothetical protein
MQAVDEYLQTIRPKGILAQGFLKKRSEDQLALERKSNAQQLARSTTRTIPDRKCRAEIKVAVYNHLVPILEQHHRAQQQLRRTCRHVIVCLSGALMLIIAAAVVL